MKEALLLIIFSIPLPFQKFYRLSTIYPCDLVFVLVFLSWLVYVITKRQIELNGRELFLSFLPFIAAGIISGTNAKDHFRLVGYIYLWLQIPLAYIMTVNVIKNRHHLNMVLYSVLAATIIFSLFYIFYSFRFHDVSIRFAQNTTFQKNIIASYIGLAPPLLLGLIFFESKPHQRILFTILMCISLISLLFTASQWGNFSLALSLLFFIFFFTKNEDIRIVKFILISIGLVSLLSFLYMYFFDQRIYHELFYSRLDSFRGRLELYKFAFALFKEHPIVGIGMGNFQNYHGYPHVHNMFFQLLAETGLIGIGALVFLLGNLIRYLIKAVRACHDRTRYIIYGAVASLICFLMNNILDFTLGHGIGIQVGIILGMIDDRNRDAFY